MATPTAPTYRYCPEPAREAALAGAHLRPTTWSAWDGLWAMLGAFLIGNAVALAAGALDLFDSGPVFLLLVASPWVAMIGWPIWVTKRRGNGPVVDLGLRLTGIEFGAGLVGGIIAFIVAIITGVISLSLFGEFSSTAAQEAQRIAQTNPLWVLVVFAVLVVVGAPLAEEILFRGLIWSGLAKRGVRPWLATLVSAIAFALLHFEPERMLILVSVGVVLGGVRWYTGSVGSAIVAHAVNNLPGAIGILALSAG